MPSRAFEALKEHIDNIWLIDTHEHLIVEEDWLSYDEGYIDFSWFFFHYVSIDVVSAGMPKAELAKMVRNDTPLDEKWKLVEPYWEKSRNTSYGRALEEAISDIFGLPGLNRETYKPLADKMREMRKPGYYKHIIRDKARIAKCIHNRDMMDVDRDLYAPVWVFDPYIVMRTRWELSQLEQESGISVYSLDDLVSLFSTVFTRKIEGGIVAAKSMLSYCRTLEFGYPCKSDAERAFNHLFTPRNTYTNDGVQGIPASAGKVLQDYMFHKLVQLCIEHDLPLEIHTGLHDDNGNYLAQSNPVLLTDIFMKYPKARFDIFHCGYPYWEEIGILTKMFPSVHVNMCWTHLGVPSAARRILDTYLEVMPANKIFGFGGDYIFVEGVLPHARLARYNVTKVLADKVDSGYFELEEAKKIADMILRDNAIEFYRLNIDKAYLP